MDTKPIGIGVRECSLNKTRQELLQTLVVSDKFK